jgi:predicted RNase H-like HicB family nuclease
MRFNVMIEKDKEGFYQVEVRDFPEIITFGKTKEEALKNAREAIECHLDALRKNDKTFSQIELAA